MIQELLILWTTFWTSRARAGIFRCSSNLGAIFRTAGTLILELEKKKS